MSFMDFNGAEPAREVGALIPNGTIAFVVLSIRPGGHGAGNGLNFSADDSSGKASGQLTIHLDGAFGGGVWKGARGTGAVDAVWDRQNFAADAPCGMVIQWNEARYGDTVFGAAALRYAPQGRLAERVDDGVVGRGSLDAVTIPVKGGAWNAKAALGAIGINWRAASGFRANFDAAPLAIDMTLDQRKVPIRIADIAGTLDLRDGWRINGAFKGAGAQLVVQPAADEQQEQQRDRGVEIGVTPAKQCL